MKYVFWKSNASYALTACILWSTAFASIKVGLKYTEPLQFAALRFILSGIMILPFCRNIKIESLNIFKRTDKLLAISLFQTFLLYVFFYLGLERVPAAVGAIIVGSGPLFVALLAHFTTGKDPISLKKITFLLIGFSGIVLIALSKDSRISDHSKILTGVGILILSNLCGSYGNILVSKNKGHADPLLMNAVQMIIGGIAIFITAILFEDIDMSIKPGIYYLSLGWLSFISAVAFSLWFIVLNRPDAKVSEINVWKFIVPLLGAIISWIFIADEYPRWYTITGMMLIGLAISLMHIRLKK